ncbi:MAG: glycosyltransferase family 1 protein [Acidobacteria bacterium]|nr:glycosyltransferase family 1 protein [Acidobacteriota bacterium]
MLRLFLDYRPALTAPTGVGAWIHELIRALLALKAAGEPVAKGLEITVFSSSLRDRLAGSAIGELAGVRPVDWRLPVRALNLAWYRLGWPPVESLAKGPFDVVHSSTPVLLPSRSGLRVSTIHDLDFLHQPGRTWGEMRRDFPRLAGDHSRRADLVVTVSNHTARGISRELGVSDGNIAICRHGVPYWVTSLATPPEPRSGGYILFVGTLEPRKNVGGLLDAYQRLLSRWPDAPRLVLAGRETPAARAWIERATGPVFKGKVDVRGYIADRDRVSTYLGAAVLVLPSFDEGFGLPALEAMALGIPVIASNRGALPEVVGDAGLLTEPEDADGIAEALRRLLTEPGLHRACREAGLMRARTFSWSDSARALLQHYLTALARQPRTEGQGAR